jgi:hypothetical protein
MHKLLMAGGMACLLFSASSVQAQDYDSDAPLPANSSRREVRTPTVSPEFLRLQRATKRAAERQQRIESRKWYGVSAQRPYISANNFNDSFLGVRVWPGIPFHPYYGY